MPPSLRTRLVGISPLIGCLALVSACAPTIKIEAPDKPIVINLNVKIDQEIRIRLDKEVEAMISKNPGIF